MAQDKGKKLKDAMAEIDLRLDGLFGKLGDTLAEIAERLEAGEDGEDGEVRRSREFDTPHGPVRAETAVRVRLGVAGSGPGAGPRGAGRAVGPAMSGGTAEAAPAAGAPAGGAASGATGSAAAEAEASRQPEAAPPAGSGDAGARATGPASARSVELATHRDGARWVLSADLPGVTLPELDVRVEAATGNVGAPRTIVVETRGARSYAARSLLPEDADPSDMRIVLRHGVLEISVALSDPGAETEAGGTS